MEKVHEIRIAATGKLEDDIVTAITRAQTLYARSGLAFKWTTNQFRMWRAGGGNHPGAAQMAMNGNEWCPLSSPPVAPLARLHCVTQHLLQQEEVLEEVHGPQCIDPALQQEEVLEGPCDWATMSHWSPVAHLKVAESVACAIEEALLRPAPTSLA